MTTPWLSIVIPTIGRDELRYTLDSIDAQAQNGSVQVLVVADTHSSDTLTPALSKARDDVYQRGPRYRWLEHDGGLHCWGQPQRQYGMEQAVGQWISFSADDNIYAPGAIASIWQAIISTPHPMPLVFRVRTWQVGLVWKKKAIENGNVDADCFVVPNEPDKLGKWQNAYNGDYEFMKATEHLWEGQIGWREELIALARPSSSEHWWLMKNPSRLFARSVSV